MAHVRKQPHTAPSPTERAPSALSVASVPSAGAQAPTVEKIAARAYEIWEQNGRPDGKDQENWFRAERELRGQPAQRR